VEIAGIAILAAVVVAAAAAPRASARVHRGWLRALGRIGRRPSSAALTCAGFSVAFAVAYALVVRWPEPRGHDELSYMLGADTFLHGRLANPTHPMWPFFETFHVLQQPTYSSKYPPAQAAAIALGWLLTGHPVAGIWLSGAVMAAALWWMLRGFLPARWALAGGLLAAAQLGAANEWMHNFWGGSVAAAGGALAIGALPRIARRARVLHSAAFGAGVALLANSRPYEGFFVALPATIALLVIAVRRARKEGRSALLRRVVPAAAIIAATIAFIAIYNRALTGKWWMLPYLEHDVHYMVAPNLLWLPLQPEPAYRHEEMRRYWAVAMVEPYLRLRSFSGFMRALAVRAEDYWQFYFGPHLTIAALGVLCILRKPWIRFALASLLIFAVGLFSETYALHHYASPATGLMVLLVGAGLQSLDRVRIFGRRAGAALAFAVFAITLVKPAVTVALTTPAGPPERSRIEARLEKEGPKHLVVVRYGPNRSLHREWVANLAEIDGQPIVWARDLGADEDRRLLEYFGDRKAWLLEVGFGDSPPRLEPFPR
jgi:hypothetical protein